MASPLPPSPLEGHCSVIYDNTLYVYSPNAFQALPLQKGGRWSKLQNGVSVTGAACVRQSGNSTSGSDALWVVGGITNDPSSAYPGLQKYIFAEKKWETISPLVNVTKNRQAHASVYLPASSQLLIYAGSQGDPTTPNSDTFLIQTIAPYAVDAYTSSNIPATWPQLVQWDDASAITLGGANGNKQIAHFHPANGKWRIVKPALVTDVKPSNQEQATLVQAADGSKILQLYDLSVSPNTVTQYVLQDPDGNPAPPGQVPGQNINYNAGHKNGSKHNNGHDGSKNGGQHNGQNGGQHNGKNGTTGGQHNSKNGGQHNGKNGGNGDHNGSNHGNHNGKNGGHNGSNHGNHNGKNGDHNGGHKRPPNGDHNGGQNGGHTGNHNGKNGDHNGGHKGASNGGHNGGQNGSSSGSRKRKRDLTLNNWPPYNATYASKITRSGFGLASSGNGLVALSGGNTEHPVELFDQNKNTWVDSSSFFGVHGPQKPLGGGGANHHNNPPSPSSTPASDQDSSHPQTTLILGATLGSIFGFIALLIIFLLTVRWRRHKRRQAAREAREQEEKGRLSFADRGDPFMKEINDSGYHPHEPLVPVPPVPDHKLGHRRSDTRGSENSTTHLVPKKDGYRMNDAMEMGPIRETSGLMVPTIAERNSKGSSLQVPGSQRKRTSGWSRYFSAADSSARTSARISQADRTPHNSAVMATTGSRKSGLSASSTRSSRESYSRYSQSLHDCKTHGPTEIPPLDMGQNFTEGRISRVVTGNNVIGNSGAGGETRERPRTISSTFSTVPPSTASDTLFSHEPPEETTAWTPVTKSEYTMPGSRNTATSSIYAGSSEGGELLYQQGPRLNVPTGSTIRAVNGATVVQRPMDPTITEEDENHYRAAKPSIAQLVTVPAAKKSQQPTPVQDDLGWIDLGAENKA